MKSANAPELIKGKTTNRNIRVNNVAVFFTVHTPAWKYKYLLSEITLLRAFEGRNSNGSAKAGVELLRTCEKWQYCLLF